MNEPIMLSVGPRTYRRAAENLIWYDVERNTMVHPHHAFTLEELWSARQELRLTERCAVLTACCVAVAVSTVDSQCIAEHAESERRLYDDRAWLHYLGRSKQGNGSIEEEAYVRALEIAPDLANRGREVNAAWSLARHILESGALAAWDNAAPPWNH